MVVHKRRDDLFRHWILGFGSGDLIVRTGGANPQAFELPNVLFVGPKLRRRTTAPGARSGQPLTPGYSAEHRCRKRKVTP